MRNPGIILTFFVIVLLSMPSNGAETVFKKILGLWEFSAPDAPQPYTDGTLTLKEVDQKLVGEFTVQGQTLPIPKIEFADDTLIMDFEVENTPISLKMVLKDGVFKGTTETPNGPVTVTAKPSITRAEKILGLWEFSAPDAPQPYDKGTLVLKDVEHKLVGVFNVEGQEVPVSKIQFADDILNLDFEVENNPISLKMVLKNGMFKGTTDTPNGTVIVTAKPVKSEVK